jgi:hypothetical protein
VFTHETVQTSVGPGSETRTFGRTVRILPRNPSQDWNENDWPARFIFSAKATFHINGKVNRHDVHVWGTENPHVTLEHEEIHQK